MDSASVGPLLDSYVTRMRAELDDLSSKAVQLSKELGGELDDLSSKAVQLSKDLGGELVASVSVHAAAPAPEPPALAPVIAPLSKHTSPYEHFVIL